MSTRYFYSGIFAVFAGLVSLIASVHATTMAPVPSREIAFIDTAVADSAVLAAAVRPGVETIMLDPKSDELAQMSMALRGRRGLTAVHVLSHGAPGAIVLGNFRLDAMALATRDFSVWRAALAPGADVLLYGCEVAKGSAGVKFVSAFAAATGANVAGSVNATGTAKKDGDWILEYAAGRVSMPSAILNGVDYKNILAAPRVVNGTDYNLYVRPGGISYTWTYGSGGTPAEAIMQTSYHEVNHVPAGATPGAEDGVLTIGKFQFSTNGGSSWSDYTVGAFTPNQNTFTTNFVPVTGTIWRFVHNNAALTTTTNMLGWAYILEGGSIPGTSTTIIPDNAPTDITASTTQRDILAPISAGTDLMTLTPVDTGLTTGGAWVLDSQTVPNLFTLASDTSTGNIATLKMGSGVLPSDGQTASVTVRYCDLFQTDGSGVQIGGQGLSKTYTYTFHTETSTALAAFGPDFKVNTTTVGSQDSPAIARLTNGNFVCVWSSANQSDAGFNSIVAQIFSPTGAKVGGEIIVSPANNGASEWSPVVTALSGDRFVVAYNSFVDADDGDTRYVLVAANGTPGAEQIANAATDRYEDALAITTLSDGSFMIGWVSYDPSYATSDILGRKFSATDGSPLAGAAGDEFTVVASSSAPDDFVYTPALTALSGGGYVATWVQSDGAYARVNSGAPFQLTTATNGVKVDTLNGGGFVAVWGGSDYDIHFQRYDSAGSAQGSLTTVNAALDGNQSMPAVAAQPGGGFIVVWQSDTGDYDFNGIFGRRFDSTGTAVDAAEFEINEYRRGDQNSPAVTALAGSSFATVWADNTADGASNTGVEARVLSGNAAPTFVGSTTTLTVAKNASATDITGFLHVSDSDGSQTLTWSQSSTPTHGVLSFTSATATTGGTDITPGGTITYTPTSGYSGNDSFTVQVSDTVATATRTITVAVCTAPDAPTIGTATAGNTQATVTFTAPASDGGASITGYTVTSSGGQTATGSASPLTVTGLTNGIAYTFTVTATNSFGTSLPSAASNSVTPKATQTITFTNPGAQNFGTTPTLTASASSGLTVTFSSDDTGVATITSGGALTFVSTGTAKIRASQAGNSAYTAATDVVHNFSVNAVAPGAPTIGTATAGNAQATVTFTAPAANGGASITGYTVTSSPGNVTATGSASPLTVTGLTNGTAYTFTVTATNSASLTGSASVASNSVTPMGTTTTTVASNLNPSTYGASVTFTATVTPSTATGTVTFKDGSTTLGTGTLSSGTATFSTSALTVSSHSISAVYAGDTAYSSSTSSTLTQTVNQASSTTTVASNLNPSAYGISVTLTATVTPSTATGTVTFKDGSTTLGTGTLSGGTATYGSSSLSASSHAISAVYGGDTNYTTSTSSTLTQTVNAIAPGAPTIGTATAGNTQATVTFTAPASDGGASIIGYTVTSSGGQTATGSASPLTVTGLTNGTAYTFTVTATNSASLTGSASAASNSVTPKATQTITFANPGAQNFGTTPTLTASASSGLTVTFTSDDTAVATITSGGALTFVSTGTAKIRASQAGDSAYAAATDVVHNFSVNAVAPGAPTVGTATAGNTQATVTFTAPAANGGASITGYTVTSSPGNVTATGSASPLTVTGLTNGTAYTFTVTATNSASLTGSASVASNSVTPAAIVISPANFPDAIQGVAYNQTITASGGASPYAYGLTGTLPTGLTLASSGVLTGTPTALGTFSSTVTATDANGTTKAIAYTVTVRAKPVVTASNGITPFTEGSNVTSTPVAIDGMLTVTDADNATLASGTVSITAGFQATEDVLAFTNDSSTMGNIAGSYDSTTGVLTLTSSGATATLAQWQAALCSVIYTNLTESPNVADRTIGFAVNDGTYTSDLATKTVAVASTDDIPTNITLSNTAILQSSGANAVVGTLTTTDADSTVFTYTLETGTGSTDNSLFNLSGSSLRANNAASLVAGTYSVRIQSDDGAGGLYTQSFAITVTDDVAPAVPVVTTASGLIKNATPTIAGTAEPLSTVKLYDDTTLLAAVTTSGAGAWSYTPSPALAEGAHTLTATATDAAGSTSLASAAIKLTIDTIMPPPPVFTTASGRTTNHLPTVQGTAEASSTLTLHGNGTNYQVAVNGSGNWTWTPPASLADGDYGFTAYATDPAGNSGPVGLGVLLSIGTAPTVSIPSGLTVSAGSSVSLTATAAGTATLSYQWQRSADGTTFTDLPGATSAIYTLGSATVANAGYLRVVVSNSFGTVTSAAAYLSVMPTYTAPKPDGYAAAATGGSAGNSVVVLTAADFRTQATSTNACVITVVGTLNLGAAPVAVASNKTIQGADASAALIGNLTLGTGVSNVVIRGLNLTNPGTTIVSGTYTDGGDALTISGASRVFVTHCTFFDCADHDIKITTGADNITISWCEFYASASTLLHRYSVQIGNTSESQPLHVTLHHNWWTTGLDQRMPFANSGYVHQYNNYVNATGNTGGCVASDQAQFLSESNVYTSVASPLTKATSGKIRVIGNVYNTCTGTAPDAGTDTVFTPAYSYELLPASDVATEIATLAGNTAGAGYTDATTSTATITGPTSPITRNTAFTLTAVPSGFVPSGYQWRFKNVNIEGATSASYTVPAGNASPDLSGSYTVAISIASGDVVVSSPIAVTINDTTSELGKVSASGGGGASSLLYLAALTALVGIRRLLSCSGRKLN